MIYGIGIDIVKIERIKKVVEKWGEVFLGKVFTMNEISYCHRKKNPYPSLAVRFAAKEAFIKAVGSGLIVSLSEVEVINADTGKPFLKVSVRLDEFFQAERIKKVHLSLSHEHDYGVASVILEQ